MTDHDALEIQDVAKTEDVGAFAERARAWVSANLMPTPHADLEGVFQGGLSEDDELAVVARERKVQRMLFDAGFAGICMPREFGGQDLTPGHQRALNEAMAGYEFPARIQVPTFSPCAAVLLQFGTEIQKRQHIPAMLKGEELWMQLLSEPNGGSDVAGVLTSAVRDGDEWVLNGSKIWTSGAWWSDWGLCLARTNWDVPKHRGLTVFMLPLHQPGIEINRIEMLNGSKEFCQEFLTDVRVPDTDRIGDLNDGWSVCIQWMFHERMLYNSPLVTYPSGAARRVMASSLLGLARDAGCIDDPWARDLIGEARMLDVVGNSLERRMGAAIRSGAISDQAAAIPRLFAGVSVARLRTIAFEIAGSAGAAWNDDDGAAAERGVDFLMRQAGCIGGGTTEMARNVISERVLGMPRERAVDRDRPFRDVSRGQSAGPSGQ